MPNWCNNEWEIDRSPDATDAEWNALRDQVLEPEFTFETWLPMPKVLKDTLSGSWSGPEGETVKEGKAVYREVEKTGYYRPFRDEEEAELAKPECRGYRNWYDWHVQVWGCKWDACEVEVMEDDDRRIALRFDTPWGPPVGVAEAFREQVGDGIAELFCDCRIEGQNQY